MTLLCIRLQLVAKDVQTLASRSRATFSASGFPYGARRLAILSYERCTPSARSSTRTVTGAYELASGTCLERVSKIGSASSQALTPEVVWLLSFSHEESAEA